MISLPYNSNRTERNRHVLTPSASQINPARAVSFLAKEQTSSVLDGKGGQSAVCAYESIFCGHRTCDKQHLPPSLSFFVSFFPGAQCYIVKRNNASTLCCSSEPCRPTRAALTDKGRHASLESGGRGFDRYG